MHHSTREFGKVKGIHKIFIIFSQSKKTGDGQFFSSGADRNIGKAASGEARRESWRPPIRHAAALLKAGERCALAWLWADCGHGGDAFITAVKIWQGRDAASSVCWRSQLPLKGKRLFCKKPSACREGSRVSEKGTSFLKIEKNEKKNGENRLTETNAFSII